MKKKGLVLVLLFCLFLSGIGAKAAEVGQFELVTNAAQIKVGDQIVIVANGSDFALSTTQNSNNRGQASVTKNATTKTVTFGADVQIINIEAGKTANTLAFYVEGDTKGYLYAAGGTSTKNNYLKTQASLNAAGSWYITVDDSGIATIKTSDTSVVKNIMRYNSSSKLFSCYSSGQADICIYRLITEADVSSPKFEVTNSPNAAILVGKTHQLGIDENSIEHCKLEDITWTSDNTSVATVDSTGLVTAVGVGKANINACVNGEVIVSVPVNTYSHDNDLNNKVKAYYGTGDYTKKTEIHLTQEAWSQFKGIIHSKATLNRTTYYGKDHILMGDFDGGFNEINSGYMNNKNGNMDHFEFSGDKSNPYINQSKSVSDTTIEEYYVALDDMVDADFFNGWELVGTSYQYKISNKAAADINPLVKDFLWFTAPGISDEVFSSSNGLGNYISQEGLTLIMEEDSHPDYGSYLSLRVVLDILDVGKVRTPEQIQQWKDENNGVLVVPDDEELTLAEARVYKGHACFNENGDVNDLYVDKALESVVTKYTTNDQNQKLTDSLALDTESIVELFGKKKTVKITWSATCEVGTAEIKNNALLYNNPSADNEVTLKAVFTLDKVSKEIEFKVKQLKYVEPAAAEELAVFNFGANISTTEHKDGSTDKTTYSETVNGYTLNLTGGSKMYPSSYDAKGNSCIKFGSSSAAGKCSFTVPENVTEVIIYVAGYKKDAAKIQINNGTIQIITTLSNDGAYTAITINTTSNKTISFTTASGGYRCMMDSIVFKGQNN